MSQGQYVPSSKQPRVASLSSAVVVQNPQGGQEDGSGDCVLWVWGFGGWWWVCGRMGNGGEASGTHAPKAPAIRAVRRPPLLLLLLLEADGILLLLL